MNRAVVSTGLLTGISVVVFAAPAACPTCADTEKTERGVDIVVANTAPVAEPDWEVLLQSRVREADRLGLLRKAQRETADNMKRVPEVVRQTALIYYHVISILSRAFFEFFQILEKLWLFAATVALYLVLPRLSTPFFRKFPLRPKNAAARWPPHSGST